MLIARIPEKVNSAVSGLLLGCISIYQCTLSPFIGGQCRFEPTCSRYAQQAIDRYGPWQGSALAIWRICRCNPFCAGGHDPVPTSPVSGTPLQPPPKSSHHDGSQT